jgi:hypothetical protein
MLQLKEWELLGLPTIRYCKNNILWASNLGRYAFGRLFGSRVGTTAVPPPGFTATGINAFILISDSRSHPSERAMDGGIPPLPAGISTDQRRMGLGDF